MTSDFVRQLPSLEGFRRVTQSLAALDAILSPEWEGRYYSFDVQWGDGRMMASMRNGSGDHWFALLSEAGIALHGLAHESISFEAGKPKTWVFADLPGVFHRDLLEEPAFDTSNSTYCIWRQPGDDAWHHGALLDSVGDGLEEQLAPLVQGADGYVEWATTYYEVAVDPAIAQMIFQHAPITEEMASRLNKEADFDAVRKDLQAIGYA